MWTVSVLLSAIPWVLLVGLLLVVLLGRPKKTRPAPAPARPPLTSAELEAHAQETHELIDKTLGAYATGPRVVQAKFGIQPPDNLAADLRALADAVDRGEVAQVVACWLQDDYYQTMFGASWHQSVFLSHLLARRAMDNTLGAGE